MGASMSDKKRKMPKPLSRSTKKLLNYLAGHVYLAPPPYRRSGGVHKQIHKVSLWNARKTALDLGYIYRSVHGANMIMLTEKGEAAQRTGAHP